MRGLVFTAKSIIAGLALTLIALPAAAKPAAVYAKPGFGREAMQADGGACWDEARGGKPRSVPTSVYTPNLYAAAGAALTTGFLQGIEMGKAQVAYLDVCMREKGYGKLELTPDEDAAFARRKDEAGRAAWLDEFLAKDWSERIAKAMVPAVPPFAPAKAEPFVFGGVRIDPARLKVAEGAVALKQPLVSGPIAHRKTAVLKQDLKIKAILDTRAETGAIFHQVQYARAGYPAGATQWCGPVSNNSIKGRIALPYCFVAEFDGYQMRGAMGETWLQGEQTANTPPQKVANGPLVLEEAETDLLGDMELLLKPVRFHKNGVYLEAHAVGPDGKVEIWSNLVKLDAEGRGGLPFWTYRLDIQRTGDTLSARLVEGGDGRGWLDMYPGPGAQPAG